jgi:hypothetical protein
MYVEGGAVMEHTIKIVDGHVQFVYSDDLADLLDEGTVAVCRVSHVEFDNDLKGWTADMSPVDGPVLGPFNTRAEGLVAEREWLAKEKGL